MARSGSLPWLLLAAVISTLFAIYLETTMVQPFVDGIVSTQSWQSNPNQHIADGKGMTLVWVRHLTLIFVVTIWIGVLIDARRSV